MQVFFPEPTAKECAKVLDTKRLGKQRIEALDIIRAWAGELDRGHTVIRMWEHNIPYLCFTYIPAIFDEWRERKYRNDKCKAEWLRLCKIVAQSYRNRSKQFITAMYTAPRWLSAEIIMGYRSLLIEKEPDYYLPIWPTHERDEWPFSYPVD